MPDDNIYAIPADGDLAKLTYQRLVQLIVKIDNQNAVLRRVLEILCIERHISTEEMEYILSGAHIQKEVGTTNG